MTTHSALDPATASGVEGKDTRRPNGQVTGVDLRDEIDGMTSGGTGKRFRNFDATIHGKHIEIAVMDDSDGWRYAWWLVGRYGDAQGLSEYAFESEEEARKAAVADATRVLKSGPPGG